MKILYLAPATSMHSIRWANAMVERKIEIVYVTNNLSFVDKLDSRVKIRYLKYNKPLGFILNKFCLKKIINEEKPDVVHCHQAAGYALLATITLIKNLLISIYGWEVFDLPYKSYIHKKIIGYILERSNFLASTSKIMKTQTLNLYKNIDQIFVTPFGVDVEKFQKKYKKNDIITIGMIKKLEDKYGVKYLIKAFHNVVQNLKIDSRLVIVGKGSKEMELKKLVKDLDIENKVEFVGRIPHDQVPKYLNMFDIYCAPSILDSESFGVAIVEAASCELPVIVTNVGGLPEVVEDEKTGYVVEPKNPEALAKKIIELIKNPTKRLEMGKAGREKVLNEYDWDKNVDYMIEIYKKIKEQN